MQINTSNSYGDLAQLLRYGAVGVIATGTHYALLVFLETAIGLSVVLGSTIGALGGAITGYLANARWTFTGPAEQGRQFMKYLVVAGCAVIANGLLLTLLHVEWHWQLWPAQLCVTAALFLATFVVNRNWSFV